MSVLKCSEDLKKLILELSHPIGTVWLTRTKDDPNELFGGTWVAVDGAYLYGTNIGQDCVDGYCGTGNKTRDHAITTNQMPSHTHFFWFNSINDQFSNEPVIKNGASFSLNEGNSLLANWAHGHKKYDGYVSNNGNSKGHNHIIPWIGVHVWYRTA